MDKRNYAARIHLMPPSGWLNDPNGLCQMNGLHHIFYQYSPEDPYGEMKYWGHYETRDFLHYEQTGVFLSPDSAEDKDGVYSGCAYVENDEMYLYYTGNVKEDGDYDYIYNGREGNTMLVTSRDGVRASAKECLLRMKDYPLNLSNHVRDPKVFMENGNYYMVLGARTNRDEGCVMIYLSTNKRTWKFDHFIEKKDFGFMWECPDLFNLEGEQYLSLSPQGLKAEEFRYQNIYQSGYFKASKNLLENGDGLGEFTEWDYGFDFYAPQTYLDESGRRILIGWMGVPGADYDHDPTIAEGWQHMLTIPRELSVDPVTKRIKQQPIAEMEQLRELLITSQAPSPQQQRLQHNAAYELLLRGAPDNFELILDEGFHICYHRADNVCEFRFDDESLGYGRTERKLKLRSEEKLEDLRILVDTCCLEIYLNKGTYVFTTKLFKKQNEERTLSIDGSFDAMQLYQLSAFTITNKEG